MTKLNEDFTATMERLFGSDEALGVYFELEEGGPRISLAEHAAMYEKLGDDMPGTISYLPNGGSAVCCTDYAAVIFLTLPGRVQIFGFANDENPDSKVARDELHVGGHDFAVVDGRYIVDPWPRLVPCAFDQMVFDMQGAGAEQTLEYYGPQSCWTRMSLCEAAAAKQALPAA
jgi:hypothetical protein